MAIHHAHLSMLPSPSGSKDIKHMKYNLYKAMQKPKIQIYVNKEYLFTLALMKLKCLMQKILSLYLQEKENRWKDTNLLRESNLFIYTSRDAWNSKNRSSRFRLEYDTSHFKSA